MCACEYTSVCIQMFLFSKHISQFAVMYTSVQAFNGRLFYNVIRAGIISAFTNPCAWYIVGTHYIAVK